MKIKYRILYFLLVAPFLMGYQNGYAQKTSETFENDLIIHKISSNDSAHFNAKFNTKPYIGKPLDKKKVIELREETMRFYQERGYPFAKIKFDSLIYIDSNHTQIILHTDKGPSITFGQLSLQAQIKIAPAVLEKQLGWEVGAPYKQSMIWSIDQSIKNIPYIKTKGTHELSFNDNKADLVLNIAKNKTNLFNGILGILPNADNSEVTISGDVALSLMNSFQHAETIKLNWKKINKASQRLLADFELPYIFKSDYGINAHLDFFKKDSSYTNIISKIGINSYLSLNEKVSFGYFRKSSVLGSIDSNTINNLDINELDFVINSFNVEAFLNNVDYFFNPKKGWNVITAASFGQKQIIPNSKIPDGFYDTLTNTKSGQIEYQLAITRSQPLWGNLIIGVELSDQRIFSKQLLENELFRIGGFKTLKGFDEESIFASSWSKINIELKYIFEENSALFLFYNQSLYQNQSRKKDILGIPYGFGAGAFFETGAGIFSISYALGRHIYFDGKRNDDGLSFQSGKIHFGFVSLF